MNGLLAKGDGKALPGPGLLGVEQIDLGELLDATLDRVEGGEHPLRRVRTTSRVIGQQAVANQPTARTAGTARNA